MVFSRYSFGYVVFDFVMGHGIAQPASTRMYGLVLPVLFNLASMIG